MLNAKKPELSLAEKRAKKIGAYVMGFLVGLLLVLALIELARSLGDLGAFQYQGY